ncbi:MAG: TlpA disulfide reductase family protein [Chitinophagaceae bacterium]
MTIFFQSFLNTNISLHSIKKPRQARAFITRTPNPSPPSQSPDSVFSEILKERSALFSAYLNASTVVAGAKAKEFNLTDIKGNSFSLADQKGKYVVLDFWGSWCVPCIQGLPKMKEYYEKYKTKVEFVGIVCNDLPGPWEAAVKKYNMKGLNYSIAGISKIK